MQLNRNQIIEINLKDLFFHILYRWRSILIAALIGAIVFCGYQYMSIKKIHDAGKLTKEERQYQLDLQNYKENLESAESTIRINTKLLQGQNTYRNESMYFQLNSQSVWTATNKYLVKIDQSVLDAIPKNLSFDPADGVLSAYTAPLNEVTEKELKDTFGTEKVEYVSELINTEISTSENSIKVTVKAATKETAQAGMALLHTKMEFLAAGRAQLLEPHTLSLVSEEIALKTDEELLEKQETLAKSIKDNQETLQEARQKLDKLEASGEPVAPGPHLIKMAVIGFIIGAIFMAFIYIVLYILKGGLHNPNDLSARYNLPIFGVLATSGSLHSNRGLDKLLSKWELGKNALDDDTVYKSISALLAEKQDIQNIQLISSLSIEKLTKAKEALAERLPGKTVELQMNATRNSDAITEASKADAVIITEAKDITCLKDTDRVVENLIISETNVIGAIIL